jgi:hypothetical protein
MGEHSRNVMMAILMGEWVGRGWGGMGDLWDSIENVNEENT